MRIEEHDSGDLAAAARGERFGRVWADRIGQAASAYRNHYERLGIAGATVDAIATTSHSALAEWYPPLAEELEAMAHGAGMPVSEIAALTARTEILVASPARADGECSTAVHVPQERSAALPAFAFQTWDWHAHLVAHAALWRYEPAPGRWVKTFTEPGMPAKIGVNGSGLTASFNILHHVSDRPTGGVPVHAVARRILDEASTLGEAHDIASAAEVSASTALTVLAVGGERAEAGSLELTPAGTALIEPAYDDWLVRTNHLLAPGLRDGNASPATSTTRARCDHLRATVTDADGAGLTELARQLCGSSGHKAPICVTEDERLPATERLRTLLTVRLDPAAGTMEYVAGDPWRATTEAAALF